MPQLFVHATDIIHGGAEHDLAMSLPRNFRAEMVSVELVRQVTNGFPPGTAHWNGGDPRPATAAEVDAYRQAIEQDEIADRKAGFKRILADPASPHRYVLEALVRLINQRVGAQFEAWAAQVKRDNPAASIPDPPSTAISRADVRTMFESIVDSADDVPPRERG